MTTELNAFEGGADFISFDASPPSSLYINSNVNGHVEAGPSRTKLTRNGTTIGAKRKVQADDDDENDSEEEVGELLPLGKERKPLNGHGSKKAKGKEKKLRGGGVNGDTGPKNLKEERRAAERHAPWADMVQWDRWQDPAEMFVQSPISLISTDTIDIRLNQEITAFYRHVSPTRAEFEVRLFVIELITRAVHKVWPDAEVTPFGSWQTQLYLPQG